MLIALSPPQPLPPKRTRVNVIQSKSGCYTCKARRIKCDEAKPVCWRCQRADRVCEGYKAQASIKSTAIVPKTALIDKVNPGLTSSRLILNPSFGLKRDVCTTRHVDLGIDVLLRDAYDTLSLSDDRLWVDLLAQLGSVNQAVCMAIATFGATYDAIYLQRTKRSLVIATAQYSKALAALHREVSWQDHGPVASLIASVILAAAQVLRRHYSDSLLHLRGAFTVMTSSFSPRNKTLDEEDGRGTSKAEIQTGTTLEGRLYNFIQSLDLQTAWYVLARPPELRPSFAAETLYQLDGTRFLQQAPVILQSLLHYCYHIAGEASHYKYRPPSEVPGRVALEQARCIAHLTQWLDRCDVELGARAVYAIHHRMRYVHSMLRVQCLSTMIYLSMILCPHEMAYDRYAAYFQQIVQHADGVLHSTPFQSRSSSLRRFRIQPGVSQALFLTSLKYRDPLQRRRAIHLLSMVGNEGPWDSEVLCSVARRAVEIEESRCLACLVVKQGNPVIPRRTLAEFQDMAEIAEPHRLHGCSMGSEAGDFEANKPVTIHFSLCNDVDEMVRSARHEDPEHWTIWTESMSVGSGPFS